jgi:hypothetical protein
MPVSDALCSKERLWAKLSRGTEVQKQDHNQRLREKIVFERFTGRAFSFGEQVRSWRNGHVPRGEFLVIKISSLGQFLRFDQQDLWVLEFVFDFSGYFPHPISDSFHPRDTFSICKCFNSGEQS